MLISCMRFRSESLSKNSSYNYHLKIILGPKYGLLCIYVPVASFFSAVSDVCADMCGLCSHLCCVSVLVEGSCPIRCDKNLSYYLQNQHQGPLHGLGPLLTQRLN